MKRIAFLTDIHLDEDFTAAQGVDPKKNFETVLNDLATRNIDEIIIGGDIGAGSSHSYFFQKLQPYPFRIILGNHDQFSEVVLHYRPDKGKSELFYRAEYGNYSAVFLDTSTDTLSGTQLLWLQEELQSIERLLLFLHHPVLAIDTVVDRLYPLKNRDALKNMLAETGKEVNIFCGHYHINDECSYMNIRQFLTQAVSFQLERNAEEVRVDNSSYGYRIIMIEGDVIRTELVTI